MSPRMTTTPVLPTPRRPFGAAVFRAGACCVGLAILAATGCATVPVKHEAPVVFPPAPEAPRIQFLGTFNGLKSIEEQSKFNRFVVGEQQDVKVNKPYGAALHDGRLYVCDTNGGVAVFDFKSRRFGALKGATGAGRTSQPVNISVAADGTKYVADPGRGQVLVYDAKDAFVRAYGQPAGWRPVDAVSAGGRLYVVDAANRIVKVLDLATGEFVASIGDKGKPEDRLDMPTNLAVDGEGRIYVTDAARFQVLKFDAEGRLLKTFGGPGDGFGRFARPKGIAVDRDGRLYVADASFNNVQIFDRDGRLLLYFGGPGEGPGTFTLPAKVAVDYDNIQYFQPYAQPGFQLEYVIVVTGQFGDRLVNVLGYGRQQGQAYPSDEELRKAIEAKRGAAKAAGDAPPPPPPADAPAPAPQEPAR